LRILDGDKPERIGVQKTSANTHLFDWRQLQRWVSARRVCRRAVWFATESQASGLFTGGTSAG
jgi:hypothetical protein